MTAEDTRKTVLRVEHVAKSFRLPTEQASGVKQLIINWTKGIKGYRDQEVLHDISFEVKQGDFFGIVGRNGSGKSTLLKLISGIYVPDRGNIQVDGRLVPFIELGVGFNPELTGRENVYLNGALLGFSTEEIDAMYEDIVGFAELGEFMDQKLKNYSSGMQVRLAFSLAIRARGDILVLDEVLAVGDEAFQRKCDDFFTKIKKDPTKTVILVTHSMGSVKKYCNNAILIKDGDILVSGNKDDVADRYTLENLMDDQARAAESARGNGQAYPTGLCEEIPLLRVIPAADPICRCGDDFQFLVEYDQRNTRPMYLHISLLDTLRGGVTYGKKFTLARRGHQIVPFAMPMHLFSNGNFRIIASMHVADDVSEQMVAFTNEGNSCNFVVQGEAGADNYALISKAAMDCVCVDSELAVSR